MGEVKRIKMILEELPCTKAQHQCQSEGVNGKAWEECGAMPGGEACVTFLDVRNFSLIVFLSASDTAWFVCRVPFLAPYKLIHLLYFVYF